MNKSLSYRIRHNGLFSLEAQTLQLWAGEVQALEDQLGGTAQRAKDFEIECLNKAGAIDELLKQRDEARDDLANKQNIVDNNRKIIDALRQTQTQLERERDEAHAERDRARMRRDVLTQEAADLRADIAQLKGVVEAVRQERDQLKEANTAGDAQCKRLQNTVAGLRTELDTAYQQTMPRQTNAYLSDYERARQQGGTGCVGAGRASGGGPVATPQSMEALATEAARKALADGSWKQVPELCNIVATIAHKLINGTTK